MRISDWSSDVCSSDLDQAIAGLLHDTIEDCGAEHETMIRVQFGDAVANIVKDCTDGTAEGKACHTDPEARRRDWIERKIGRASCRERVCQYVKISVVAVSLKTKKRERRELKKQ